MRNDAADVILYHLDEAGIAALKVNRPQARNALNWAAQERFAEVVTHVASDSNARALIVTGIGDRAFVSGGDLKELQQHLEKEAGERLNHVMSGALAQLRQLPIPVIAAINGDAFGGGCEIVTACDLRLTGSQARFSFAQVRNALITGWGGTNNLVRLIGQSRALELLLTGRMFDAKEARQMGLVHRVVAEEVNVFEAAYEWAVDLIKLPREALAATKRLVYATDHLSGTELAQMESDLFVGLWDTPNHLEALNAFAEKRPPIFNQARKQKSKSE